MNAGIGIVATKAGKQQVPTAGAGDKKSDVRGDFEEKILEIGDQVAALAAKTATLPDAIDNVTTILRDRVDKQMTKFRGSHPEFYAGYQSARVVVSRGGSGGTPPPSPATVSPK